MPPPHFILFLPKMLPFQSPVTEKPSNKIGTFIKATRENFLKLIFCS